MWAFRVFRDTLARMDASAPAVEVRQLDKRFGAAHVVRGISFDVAPGEIYGLIGPNGAGKTTTFRIVAGLMQPSAGTVMLCGSSHTGSTASRSRLGLSTGSSGLYGRLTAREQLAYFGALHDMERPRIEERIHHVSEALDLARLLHRRCDKLSTGERQRVAIARAVLHDPPVLILDEPTAGLDVLASRFLRDFVVLARDQGKAILFSTHYLAEAELLCDRIGFLHEGRILAEGAPGQLKQTVGASTLEEAFLGLVRSAQVTA